MFNVRCPQMSPSYLSHLARKLFPRRWWFLATSALGVIFVFAAFSSGSAQMTVVASILAGPVIFVPWALLCTCIWFHPERGNLQPTSKLVGKLPNMLQAGIRWYASIFLTLFVVVGALVWPAISLAWL